MPDYNPANERIKRRYVTYLREADGFGEDSVDAVAKAIDRFERYTRHRDFKQFHVQQAIGFKRQLAEQRSERKGVRLSRSTVYHTLRALRNFFHWLAGQQGYRSRLAYSDAEYFNLTDKEVREACPTSVQRAPTMEQIQAVVRAMPTQTLIERRDRAIVAFVALTGVRDGALVSLRLKHVDVSAGRVTQDAREVATKNSKSQVTQFFPVPEEFRAIVGEWTRALREEELWGDDDPLFAATDIGLGDAGLFQVRGMKRSAWSSAEPVRTIFRRAFTAAGLPYFNPHSFRKTLALMGERVCRTPEEMKAWSQNLGHEMIQTTFSSYGQVPLHRQSEIIAGLSEAGRGKSPFEELALRIAREFGDRSGHLSGSGA